jgi:hypothetical protein
MIASLKHIRLLRHEGDLNEAANAIQPLLNSTAPEVIVEIVRLAIMLNRFDVANQLFQSLLSKGDFEDYCEIELLCRLDAQAKGAVPPHFLAAQRLESTSDWVVRYLSGRIDKIYLAGIQSCQVNNRTGWILYKFTIRCVSCNTVHKIQLVGTLLLKKIYFCPRCFAKLEITFDIISTFLRTHCTCFLGAAVENIDKKLITLAQSITEISSDAQALVSYLNQDYIFMLCQIVVSELLKKCDESEAR